MAPCSGSHAGALRASVSPRREPGWCVLGASRSSRWLQKEEEEEDTAYRSPSIPPSRFCLLVKTISKRHFFLPTVPTLPFLSIVLSHISKAHVPSFIRAELTSTFPILGRLFPLCTCDGEL